MPRKFAAILPAFSGGGAERVTATLLESLDPDLWQIQVIAMDDSGPFGDLFKDRFIVKVLGIPRMRAALPSLVAAIRRFAPDVVYSTFWHVNLPLLAIRPALPKHTKIIIREANLPSANITNSPAPKLVRAGYRALYRSAHMVLGTSGLMRQELLDLGVRPETFELLRNPVDEDHVRERGAKSCPLLQDYSQILHFVAAGRLTKQKGFDRLIRLLRKYPPNRPWRCTIYGQGTELERLRALRDESGLSERITFAGFSRDLWSHLARADSLLMPSRWEGMPNAALEALALGTPVIATPESGGIQDIADAAPAGAVNVATMGLEFAAAIQAVSTPPTRDALRPSLLPDEYRLPQVTQRFQWLMK